MATSYPSGSEISGAFGVQSEASQKATKGPCPLRMVKEAITALKEKDGSTLKDIARYIHTQYANKMGNDTKEVAKALQTSIKKAVQREALSMSKSGKIRLGRAPIDVDRRRRRRGSKKGKKGKGRRRRRRRRGRGKKGKKGKKGKGRRRRRRGRKGKKGKR